jgi:methyltransferase (TIGR00027 family)
MSIINEVGSTAFIIAAYHAEEEHNDNPLFVSKYSKYFMTNEGLEKADDYSRLFPEGKKMIRYRIKFFNDIIKEHVKKGTKQIVILGSGFDMRACDYINQDVVFYDVDQFSVIKHKKEVIEKNKINYPARLVECNYVEEDLIDKLFSHGFDFSLSTLFIWEGNVFYLSKKFIYSFLNVLYNKIENFHIAYDYVTEQVVLGKSKYEPLNKEAKFFADIGAGWLTGFDDVNILEEKTSLHIVKNVEVMSLEKNTNNDEIRMLPEYLICVLGS